MPTGARTWMKAGVPALLALVVLALAGQRTSNSLVASAVLVLALLGALAYLAWHATPHHVFTLAIVAAPFAGNWEQLGIPGALALERLLLAVGILTVVLRAPAVRDRPRLHFEPVHWLLLLTAAYAAGSAFVSGTLFERAPGIQLFETFGILPFLVFTLAPVVYPTARERAVLLQGLMALGAYLAVTTLLEMAGGRDLIFPRYIADPDYGLHFGRGRGPFADAVANGFGLFACALAAFVALRTWRSPFWRAFAAVVAALCLVGTLLTLERSVWIATVAGLLALVLAAGRGRRALLPVAGLSVLAVVLAFAVVPGLADKVTERGENRQSVWDRKNLAHTGVAMVEARPLFGVGWARFVEENEPYLQQSPDYPLTASDHVLHNVALTYAVELGLVGAGLWVAALLLGVGGALLRRGPPALDPWRAGLLALFVFFAIQGSFVPPTVFQNLCLWLWAGVVWAGSEGRRRDAAEPAASFAAPVPVAVPEPEPESVPRALPPPRRQRWPEHHLLPATTRAGSALVHAAAAADWRGPDPYDGLLHRWPRPLRGGPRRRQAIVQLHARAPIDIRRLYGRREHPRIPKALALFGQSALRLDAVAPDARLRAEGEQALRLLLADGGEAWGYPFDVQTRWSFYPAGAPNVVVTSFAGHALEEAAERLGDPAFATRADRAARWTLEHAFDARTGAFSYHEHSDTVIHNANLLAARLVWSRLRHDAAARDAVHRAVERSLAAQAPDGSWEYGAGDNLAWRDSFHTGFVLLALAELREVDGAVDTALERGAPSYERFFGPGGQAQLWLDRPHPEDAHAAGTGLSALVALRELGLVEPQLVRRVTARTLGATLRDGHAVWRRWARGSTHVTYLRWCDAHVARGLADVALANGEDAPVPDRHAHL
jgi:putative inorganic carbon (hco3(-)) transporter